MTRPRLAAAADLDEVQRIVSAAYTPWIAQLGQRPGPMDDDYSAAIAAGCVYLCPGGVLVLKQEPGALLLDNVAVDPTAQGRGIGKRLLGFAENEAHRRGLPKITLYTHAGMTTNRALYARFGYQETHRITERGLPRVYMAKTLSPPPRSR